MPLAALLVAPTTCAHLLQGEADRGELRRIDLDANRGLLVADDRGLGHARHLRQRLDEDVVEVIVDGGERQSVGVRPQHHDRGIRRVDLAVIRRLRHRLGQELARRRDRGLDVLGGEIDVAVEVELDHDLRHPERAQRRHLGDAGNLSELALQGAATEDAIVPHSRRRVSPSLDGREVHLGRGARRTKTP